MARRPGGGFSFEFKTAQALATATTSLPAALRAAMPGFGRMVMTADIPTGWLPDGPDDPLLAMLFARAISSPS